MKGRSQNLMMLAAIAALVFVLFSVNKKSNYSITENEYAAFDFAPSPAAGPAAGLPSLAQPPAGPPANRKKNWIV